MNLIEYTTGIVCAGLGIRSGDENDDPAREKGVDDLMTWCFPSPVRSEAWFGLHITSCCACMVDHIHRSQRASGYF